MTPAGGLVRRRTAPGVLGVDIRPVGQEYFDYFPVAAQGRRVQGSLTAVVANIHVSALDQE
jgi:hypothetical protein